MMTRRVSFACLFGLLILALAPVAPGEAAVVPARAEGLQSNQTFSVHIDGQPPDDEPWAFNRFFPDELKVHQGDTVQVSWAGTETPHTATAVPAADANAWRKQNQGQGGAYSLVIP